jgi:hypothetical protein
MPDRILSNHKSQFGYILEGLGTEKVGILFGHLENITAIWYILRPLGHLVVICCIFPRFGIIWYNIVSKNLATLIASDHMSRPAGG